MTADEECLGRSIVALLVEVVDGYQPVMPRAYGDRLNDEAIVASIRSLR